MSRISLYILLSVTLLLSGCNFPSPAETIKSPGVRASGLQQAARALLPDGAVLVRPGCTEPGITRPLSVQECDLDGDGKRELVAGYKLATGSRASGVLIASKEGNTYRRLWREEIGYGLADLRCEDVTGDGVPEVIIGATVGASAGNSLKILKLSQDTNGKPVIRTLVENGYHRMDIGDFDHEGRREVALWSKDTGNAYAVTVYRWDNPDVPALEPVQSAATAYFPRVARYYEQQVKEAPQNGLYWYYLADAQLKSGQPARALQSLQAGRRSKTGPAPGRFTLVEAESLLALGRYQAALEKFASVAPPQTINSHLNPTSSPPGTHQGTTAASPRDLAQACLGMGRAFEAMGKYKEAEKAYTRAQQLLPGERPKLGEKDLARLATRPAVARVLQYLASIKAQDRAQAIAGLDQWGKNNGLYIRALTPGPSVPSGLPSVLLLEVSKQVPPAGTDAYLICWWKLDKARKTENFFSQVFYSVEVAEHGLGQDYGLSTARLALDNNGRPEMAVVYDSCAWGSGSPIPTYYLFRLENHRWRIVWRAPAPGPIWRAFHGTIVFSGADLESFHITGDIWNDGGKGSIFAEANVGPHRRFSDTWERKDDTYRLTRASVVPSAYNTLTEFIWALSTGDENRAFSQVTQKDLVKKARQAGLVQSPLGQRWLISWDDDIQLKRGPLTILSGPAAGTTITFKKSQDHWLINSISKKVKK